MRTPFLLLGANVVAVLVAVLVARSPGAVLAVLVAENAVVGALLLLRLGGVYRRRRWPLAVTMGLAIVLVLYAIGVVAGLRGMVPWLHTPDAGFALALLPLAIAHAYAFVREDVRGRHLRRALPFNLAGAAILRLTATLLLAGAAGLLLTGGAVDWAIAVGAFALKTAGESWAVHSYGASGARPRAAA